MSSKSFRTMGEYFQHYEKESRASIGSLTRRQRLIFVLIVCERFRPYYESFANTAATGDATLFDRVGAVIRNAIDGHAGSAGVIEELQKAIEAALPSEDVVEASKDIEVAWLAQDGLDVCLSALGAVTGGARYENEGTQQFRDESEHVWWVANACYDAADREASNQILPDGGVYTPEIEGRIATSFAIERELTWQFETVEIVAGIQDDSPIDTGVIARAAAEPLLRGIA